MTSLLSAKGVLVTLIFPIVPGLQGGPPFEMSVDLVANLLSPTLELISLEVPEQSHPGREGKEMLAMWRKKGN